nr:hypothetical protein [Bacteroidota bacterium]
MKLLLFIALFVLIYYLLSKYIFPYLIQRFIRKAQEKFQQFGQQNHPVDNRKEGEVKVDYVPPEAKKSGFNAESAEDVDFEEIKDK